MNTVKTTLGSVIKERRLKLGLTQAELARRVGCAEITVRKLEADALRPSVQMSELLALALGIPENEQLAFVQLARQERPLTPIPTPSPMREEIGQEDLSGRAIRGYELGRRINAGGFGVVYEAVQTTVDRDVAVKIILPKYADHPDFIRRFEVEAQLVAQLEHPHIVPLYDYWREPGVAYLIMQLMRGGSLEDMLKEGALPPETLMPMLIQVGAALHTAHQAGIIHRDIKPANVLLDDYNNAYLADFGIAKNLGLDDQTQVGAVIGSPAYISPEQIKAEPVKAEADIYGLGIMVYELLTGSKPFQGPTPIAYIQQHLNEPIPPLAEGLPPQTEVVLLKATAKNPADRYDDVPAFLDALQKALFGETAVSHTIITPLSTAELAKLENPYKGLRAFTEADAHNFFGRETLIQSLLTRMADGSDLSRFLAIVGPSGSGKSSVAKAGLVPALRRGGIPDSDKWFTVEMTPGSHPFEELEAALLRVAINPPESILAQLQENERGLLRASKRILPADPDIELLLLIDQFEELFTLTEYETVRLAFLDSLVTAVLDPRSRLRIVITMRADFIDKPLQYVDFGDLMRQRTEFVLPLTADELEQVIVKPVDQQGMTLEAGLVAQIIHDAGNEPGLLPLLQYALTELFDGHENGRLTKSAYEENGGVLGALGHRGDDIYQQLNADERESARQLFLRLITLGEGVEDTRRRVRRSELLSMQTAVSLDGIIDKFGAHRLLTFDRDPITREPTVEIAHEALLREWGQLRDWVADNRDDMRMGRVLETAVNEWQAADKDESYLLRGSRLAQFEGWMGETAVVLTANEQSFLNISISSREEELAADEKRQQRELETAQQLAETERLRADEQTQSAGRLRKWAMALAGVLIIAVLFAIAAAMFAQQSQQNANVAATRQVEALANAELAASREAEAVNESNQRATAEAIAIDESIRADEQRDNAIAAEATAEAESIFRATAEAIAVEEREEAQHQASIGFASQALTELNGKFPERAVPLALEALENYPYTWQAERALGQSVLESRIQLILEGHDEALNYAVWSPDNSRIATTSKDHTAIIWDGQTGEKLFTLSNHSDNVFHAGWSPDNEKIATTSFDGTARIWNTATGEELFVLANHEDNVYRVAWSPTGDYLITASEDGTAKVWDGDSGEELYTLPSDNESPMFAVAWSPTGDQVATGDFAGGIIMWDSATGERMFSLDGHENFINQIEWSPNGEQIVTASDDHTARIWDAATGAELHTLTGHTAWVPNALWSPDGSRIATSSEDASVRMWDANTGETIFIFDPGDLQGDRGYPNYISWAPDGEYLATTRFDGTITILNAATGAKLYTLPGSSADPTGLNWSTNDRLVASSGDSVARVWDVSQRANLFTHGDITKGATSWSPSGDKLAIGDYGGTVQIWDTGTWEELLSISVDEQPVWKMMWCPSGECIVTRSFSGMIKIWDGTTGEELLSIEDLPGIGSLAISPTGEQLISGNSDGIAQIWDASTGELLSTFNGHDGVMILRANLSPDGQHAVTSDVSNRALIWGVESGEIMATLQPEESGWMTAAVWSPDGKQIATHSDDIIGGRIWDATTGELLQAFRGHSGSVWGLEWSASGDRILTSSGDSTVKLWDAENGVELLSYSFDDWPMAAWSPDYQQIAVSLGNGDARIIDVHWNSYEELLEYARENRLIRELTPEERGQFGLPPADD